MKRAMNDNEQILDLDYDSPLESLFWFLGNAWCMGITTAAAWFLCIVPGKNGSAPIWADFPLFPVALGMLLLWAIGFWLKANYDVRYQLNAATQQLELVRKVFGRTFRSRVAGFSDLYSTAILSSWSEDKQGNRSWSYALALVTTSARLVRVSSWEMSPQSTKAAQVSRQMGLKDFPSQREAGTLKARRQRDGSVSLRYAPPGPSLIRMIPILGIVGAFLLLAWSLWMSLS